MSYDINNQIDYNYFDLESSSSDESAAPERDVLEILASRERVEEEINPTGNPVHVSLSNLDHGDRAVLRISDERDRVQKKAFTKWLNQHLCKVNCHIEDLYADLRDGHVLISLLEILSQQNIPRETGRMRFHRLANVQHALDFLRRKKVRLVNLRKEEIVDGNPKLTLGLVWTIILHYHITEVLLPGTGQSDENAVSTSESTQTKNGALANSAAGDFKDGGGGERSADLSSAKEALLLWCRKVTSRYPGVTITDFSQSWRSGLAFLALIHRFYPQIVNLDHVHPNDAHSNLQLAFSLAERHLGVRPILEPEDLLMSREPDEKCVITYLTSLYLALPHTPADLDDAVFDDEKSRRVSLYKELAEDLLEWLEQAITALTEDTDLPRDLIQLRNLQKNLLVFKQDIMHAKLVNKYKIESLHDEITAMVLEEEVAQEDEIRENPIPKELSKVSLNNRWIQLQMLVDRRSASLRSHINRVEADITRASKIQQDVKSLDNELSILSDKINLEKHRIQSSNSSQRVPNTNFANENQRRTLEELDHKIWACSNSVKQLFGDCENLIQSKFVHAEQLRNRVSVLLGRVDQLSAELENLNSQIPERNIFAQVTSPSGDVEMFDKDREHALILEQIDSAMKWIKEKNAKLAGATFGVDLESVRENLKDHETFAKEVKMYRINVEQCLFLSKTFNVSTEQKFELSSKVQSLEKSFSALSNEVSERDVQLKSLLNFLELASQELSHFNDIERDLTSKYDLSEPVGMDVNEANTFVKNLIEDLALRDDNGSFRTTVYDGESLITCQHPATQLIRQNLENLSGRRDWIFRLVTCFEHHLGCVIQHKEWYRDAKSSENWLWKQEQILQSRFDAAATIATSGGGFSDVITHEQAESLLVDLYDMRELLVEHKEILGNIIKKGKQVYPMELRAVSSVDQDVQALALCSSPLAYQMKVNRGEKVSIITKMESDWIVKLPSGKSGKTPSIILTIQPPSKDAVEFAERLEARYQSVLELCVEQCMRVQMASQRLIIMKKVASVKSWTPKKFREMQKVEREAMIRSLNEETRALLETAKEITPDQLASFELQQLSSDVEACNRIYHELSSKQKQDMRSNVPMSSSDLSSRIADFLARIDNAQNHLGEALSVAPKSMEEVAEVIEYLEKIMTSLSAIQGEYNTLRFTTCEDPNTAEMLKTLCFQWDRTWTTTQTQLSKMKLFTKLHSHMTIITCDYVTRLERTLKMQDSLPNKERALLETREKCEDLNISLAAIQPQVDAMVELSEKMTDMLLKETNSRLQLVKYPACNDLLSEVVETVQEILERWNNIQYQCNERVKLCNQQVGLLKNYLSDYVHMSKWLDRMEERAPHRGQKPLDAERTDALYVSQLARKWDDAKDFYDEVTRHHSRLEEVNTRGNRCIKEIANFDNLLTSYVKQLHQMIGGGGGPDGQTICGLTGASGTELGEDLDEVINRYQQLLFQSATLMKDITDLLKKIQEGDAAASLVKREKQITETVTESQHVDVFKETAEGQTTTRVVQNPPPPIKAPRLQLPDFVKARAAAIKGESLKDTKIEPGQKPIELKPYVVPVTPTSPQGIRASKRKRETVTTSIEMENEYYVVRETDSSSNKLESTGTRIPVNDPRVQELLQGGGEIDPRNLSTFDAESSKGLVEITRVYTDDKGVTHNDAKYFKPDDPKAAELLYLFRKGNDEIPESEEKFIVCVETEIINGEEVLVEKVIPVDPEEPRRKFKTAYEKDHFVEITRVVKDPDGRTVEEVKKFRKGDPAIDQFVAGLPVVSSKTVSEKYLKTSIEETRSEYDPDRPSNLILESSKTKIHTTIDREIEEELLDNDQTRTTESASNNRSSTPVQKSTEIPKIVMPSKNKAISIVVQGRKLEEIWTSDSDCFTVSLITAKVMQDLRVETSQQVFLPEDADVAKFRLEGSLPSDLSPNQSYSCSEVFVEVEILKNENEDRFFSETLLFKPRDSELSQILRNNNLKMTFERMLKIAVKTLVDFGEIPSTGLGEIMLTEQNAINDSEVAVVVEQIAERDSTEVDRVYVKFQTCHGEKVWEYQVTDPELRDMVNAGIIPENALPSKDDENQQSASDEIIEIVLGEGANTEKLYFRLDDPKLLEQVKGTDYEEEVLNILSEAGVKAIRKTPNIDRLMVSSRRRSSASDVSGYMETASSTESLVSEQEIEGMKVSLHTVKIEDKTDKSGRKYSLVTKTYLSEVGDKVEFERKYDVESEKLDKLRAKLPVYQKQKQITYIDTIDMQPQFELPLSAEKEVKTTRKVPEKSEERSISPASRSLSLLQTAVTVDGVAPHSYDAWSYRIEDGTDEKTGERMIRVFNNEDGVNVETVHRADSPTILNLVETGVLPESFCATPVHDRSTEEVVQRKFLVKKRETPHDDGFSFKSEIQSSNNAVYVLKVEDVVEDSSERLVMLTERFVDENGEESVSQELHRPKSPTLLNLVDQGLIPAPFLLEEPDRELISDDPNKEGFFLERVVKRVYERVNSDFVPFIPDSSQSPQALTDLNKIDGDKFDFLEAEMNIQEVKMGEEKLKNGEKVVNLSRKGVDSKGNFVSVTTRHRASSPTLKQYKDAKVPLHNLSDTKLASKMKASNHFQPYLSAKEVKNDVYRQINNPDWLSGNLSSQQQSRLLFVDDKTLTQICQAVKFPQMPKSFLRLNSWDVASRDEPNLKMSTTVVELIRGDFEKVVMVSSSLQDLKGSTIFNEVREFAPTSNYVTELINLGRVPKSIKEDQLSTTTLALKVVSQNLKHRKSSEKSEIVYETVKTKEAKARVPKPSRAFIPLKMSETDDILRAKLDEEFSEEGNKYLSILQVRKSPFEREVMEIRRYPPQCVFIDELIKYNELPKSLQTPLPSEKTTYIVELPKSLWDNSLGEAMSIESHERLGSDEKEKQNVYEVLPGQVPSSLQQRITEINIKSRKKSNRLSFVETSEIEKDPERIPNTDDFTQEVAILTAKTESKAEETVCSSSETKTELMQVSEEEPIEPSKFISSLLRKCRKFVVSDVSETPNKAEVVESKLPEDEPVTLDVSSIVLSKALLPQPVSEGLEKPEAVEFYQDPIIKEVLPDLASQFDKFPKEVQESITTRIQTISRKRRESASDIVEEEIPPLSAEIVSLARTGDFEMPCEIYSVQAEKCEGKDEDLVLMRREMGDQDAVESRQYPIKTPFVSELVKQGKLFKVGEAEPSLNEEQEVEIPAVDWLASIGEVKAVALAPTKALSDNNSSLSSIGGTYFSQPLSRFRLLPHTGSPSDSFTTDLESGYESVTPVFMSTPPLDKDKDLTRDQPVAHVSFRAIPPIAEENLNDLSNQSENQAALNLGKDECQETVRVEDFEKQRAEPVETENVLNEEAIEGEGVKESLKETPMEVYDEEELDHTKARKVESTTSRTIPQKDSETFDALPEILDESIFVKLRDGIESQPNLLGEESITDKRLEFATPVVETTPSLDVADSLAQSVIPENADFGVSTENTELKEGPLSKLSVEYTEPLNEEMKEEDLGSFSEVAKRKPTAQSISENRLDLTKLDSDRKRSVESSYQPPEGADSVSADGKEPLKKIDSPEETTPNLLLSSPPEMQIVFPTFPTLQMDMASSSEEDLSSPAEPSAFDSIDKFQPIITSTDSSKLVPQSELEAFQPILKVTETKNKDPKPAIVTDTISKYEPEELMSDRHTNDLESISEIPSFSAESHSNQVREAVKPDRADPALLAEGVAFLSPPEIETNLTKMSAEQTLLEPSSSGIFEQPNFLESSEIDTTGTRKVPSPSSASSLQEKPVTDLEVPVLDEPIQKLGSSQGQVTSGLMTPASSLQSVCSTDMRETEVDYELCMTMANEYDSWLQSMENKLAQTPMPREKSGMEPLTTASALQKQMHQSIIEHKKLMTEAVSEMQILLDKRSQYLTPEQTRQIRNSISRLSAGYDSVYDVSASNIKHIQGEIEKEKHRQKENDDLNAVLGECETMLSDTMLWLNTQERELSLIKPLSGEIDNLETSKSLMEKISSKVASKIRDMDKRVATVSVLAAQRDPSADCAESDKRLKFLLESLPKKLTDFHEKVNHRIHNVNSFSSQAESLQNEMDGFSQWLANFENVTKVPNDVLEDIVLHNDELDRVHLLLSNYDKNIKNYNRDVIAEELKSMKRVHHDSLKKSQSPSQTSFEIKYHQLTLMYNDLLKLCDGTSEEPTEREILQARFAEKLSEVSPLLAKADKDFKSLVMDPPELLSDVVDGLDRQIHDLNEMRLLIDELEFICGKIDADEEIPEDEELRKQLEAVKSKHEKLLKRIMNNANETKANMLLTQKTPEERKEYVQEEIEEAIQKLELLKTYAPNKDELDRGMTGLRGPQKSLQSQLPQLRHLLENCDLPEDFVEEKLKELGNLQSEVAQAETSLNNAVQKWNDLENQIATLDSSLARKLKDLCKIPMTEVHFDKLHKYLKTSSSEMPAVDTHLTNLRFAVGEMAKDPNLKVSEENQSALEKSLQHCEQSHQQLMTCLNDKALKLDKLQELIKRFEKAQKCCDDFLQEKRMFLGCSEVPDIDPQSMKKLYDELLPVVEQLHFFQPRIDDVMQCSKEIRDILASEEQTKDEDSALSSDGMPRNTRQYVELRHESEKFRIDAEYVKNEYDHILNLATKRKQLLEDLIKETNTFFEEMRVVTSWLVDKETNMSHAEPISLMSLETIRTQLNSQNRFYQSLVDESSDPHHKVYRLKQLPIKLNALLQNLPPESKCGSLVGKNVDSLIDRYNFLVERSRDKLSVLQLVNQEVASFEEMHEELLTWLQAKESAINQLGLIGVQQEQLSELKLQLKIIEVDFSTKQVRLDQYVQLAQTMQLHLSAPIRSKSTVKQKMTLVTQTWQDLQNRVKDRSVLAEAALKESTKLNESLGEVKKWMTSARDVVDAMPNIYLDAQSIKAQLGHVQKLQSELDVKKTKLNEANDAFLLLTDMSESRRQKKKLEELMENISVPFYDLAEALDTRSEKLNRALVTMTELSSSVTETISWLEKWTEENPQHLSLSADYPKLKSNVAVHEQKLRNFMSKEEVVKQLLKAGDEIIAKDADVSPESTISLQNQLDLLKSTWQNALAGAKTQKDKIESVTASSATLDQSLGTLDQWITDMEKKKDMTRLTHFDSYTMETYIQSLKAFDKQLDAHAHEQSSLTTNLLPELLRAADFDHDLVQIKVNSLNSRWDALKAETSRDILIGENLTKQLSNHNEALASLYNDLSHVRDMSEIARKKEVSQIHVDSLKDLENGCSQLVTKWEEMSHILDQSNIPEDCNCDAVREDLEKMGKQLIGIQNQIRERLGLFDCGSEATKDINDKLENLGEVLIKSRQDLKTIVEDPRLREDSEKFAALMNELQSNISNCHRDLSNLMNDIDQAKSKDYPINELVLSQQVNYLSEEFDKLESSMSENRIKTENAIKAMQSLKNGVSRAEELCEVSNGALEAMKTPATVEESRNTAIKLDENKMNTLDDLALVVCGLTSEGVRMLLKEDKRQGMSEEGKLPELVDNDAVVSELVDNAVQSTNIALSKQMERRLETAEVFFNESEEYIPEGVKCLYDAIAQHEELRTDVALMFAAPNLHQCVADTIQIQEELLNRFQIVYNVAEVKVSQHPELSEAHSFEELKQSLENARENLSANKVMFDENAAQIKEFFDQLNPLRDILNKKMKEIDAISRSGSIDPKKVDEQVLELEQISSEIESQMVSVEAVRYLGWQMTDDKEVFPEVYYAWKDMDEEIENLEMAIKDTRLNLETTLRDLQEFEGEYEELVEWLTASEQRLQAEGPVLIVPDDIHIQIARNRAIDREIRAHGQQVDCLIELGENLLKNGGESGHKIALQRRLDAVDQLFETVSDASNERLRKLGSALPLATDFGETHRNLSEWFDTMENELSTKMTGSWDQLLVKHRERMQQLQLRKTQLDIINDCGPKLVALTSGEESRIVENSIHENNNRYYEIEIGLKERGNQLEKALLETSELKNQVNSFFAWINENLETIDSLQPVTIDRKDEEKYNAQKEYLDKLFEEFPEKEKLKDELVKRSDELAKRTKDRSSRHELLDLLRNLKSNLSNLKANAECVNNFLIQGRPLVEEIEDLSCPLEEWMDEVEPLVSAQFNAQNFATLSEENLKQEQNKCLELQEGVQSQRIPIGKLQKNLLMIEALYKTVQNSQISNSSQNNESVGNLSNRVISIVNRYNVISSNVEERAQQLYFDIQESLQYREQTELILTNLATLQEALIAPESVSSDPKKLKEQLKNLSKVRKDLEDTGTEIQKIQANAEQMLKSNPHDLIGKELLSLVEEADKSHKHVKELIESREAQLDNAFESCTKFWRELKRVSRSIKEQTESLENSVKTDPPGVNKHYITQQQAFLQAIREEMEGLGDEVDWCQNEGAQSVLGSVAEVEKSLVFRSLEDLQNQWDWLNTMFSDREQSLVAALASSEQFTKASNDLKRWLDKIERIIMQMPRVFETPIKAQQTGNELRKLKHDLGPKQVELDSLIAKATKLKNDATSTVDDDTEDGLLSSTNENATQYIDTELNEVQSKWESVCMQIMERQQALDEALSRHGHDDSALHELLLWLDKAEQDIAGQKTVAGDMASIEVEIAKLKMLQNDLHAHQSRFDVISRSNKAAGRETNTAQMNEIKGRLGKVSQAGNKRQNELESCKRQAIRFQNSVAKLNDWLQSKEPTALTAKPLGGFPKSIQANLKAVNNLLGEFREKESSILKPLRNEASTMLSSCQGDLECSAAINQSMQSLEERWSNAHSKAISRKAALEDVLQRSKAFEDQLNQTIQWLTEANTKATVNRDVSVLVEGVLRQTEQHKPFHTEVEAKRQSINELEKNSLEHKSNSDKQEMAMIKNLVLDIKHRYEEIVRKVRDHNKRLEDGVKRARQFHGQWKKLYDYLSEEDAKMKTEDLALTTNVAQLKQQLTKHKEVQKGVQQKQHQVEAILKAGKALKEKCRPFPNDAESLNKMMKDLRTKWESTNTRAASRQHRLEAALVRCGQLKDALGVLKEWLISQEISLDPSAPLPIDLDSLAHSIQHNKTLLRELSTRQKSMNSLVKSANEQGDDSLKDQLKDLVSHWDTVNELAEKRKMRLESALNDAKHLDESLKDMYAWLAEAEQRVRFHGPLPDDIEKLEEILEQHTEFAKAMAMEQQTLDNIVARGNEMIKKNSDLITPTGGAVNTIAAASNQRVRKDLQDLVEKWADVTLSVDGKTEHLNFALDAARQAEVLLEDLVAWIGRTEDTLAHAAQHPIPSDLDAIEGLLTEHEELEDEMTARQVDMDKLLAGPQSTPHHSRSRGRRETEVTSRASSNDTNPLTLSSTMPDAIASRLVDKKGRKTKIPIRTGYKSPGNEKAKSQRSPSVNSSSSERSGHTSPRSEGPSAMGSRSASGMRKVDSRDSLASGTSSVGTGSRLGASSRSEYTTNPRVHQAKRKYQRLWLQAMERKRKLNAAKDQVLEERALENFSFEDWRRNYMKWMQHKKSRVIDFFRKQDTDCDGRVTKQQFIDGVMKSGFTTNRTEMGAVADIFDRDNDGYIDYQEFMTALRPDRVRAGSGRRNSRVGTDEEKIMTELKRQISHCTCCKQFMVIQVGDGKYRFGESQRMRLVRVLRSTVMVRVGGGWQALDEFLVKNDPCRVRGRTKQQTTERTITLSGKESPTLSDSMWAFKSKNQGSVKEKQKKLISDLHQQNKQQGLPMGAITEVKEKNLPNESSVRDPSDLASSQTCNVHKPIIKGHQSRKPPELAIQAAGTDTQTFYSQSTSSPHSGRVEGVTHVRTVKTQLRTLQQKPHLHNSKERLSRIPTKPSSTPPTPRQSRGSNL